MRLHSDRDKKQDILPELVTAGCELLRQLPFTKHDREDHRIGEIAKSCLKGDQGVGVVQELCGRLKAAVEKSKTYIFHHDDLLQGIFLAQPIATLEALCGGNVDELNRGVRMLRDAGIRKRPLAVVPDKDLLRWCDEEPEARYVAMAGVITSFEPQKGSGPRWTGLALQFLERAPDPVAVLSQFTAHFLPSGGWSGSLASIVEANATLLDQLDAFPGLQTAIAQEKARVQQWIAKERSRESLSDRERNERFE